MIKKRKWSLKQVRRWTAMLVVLAMFFQFVPFTGPGITVSRALAQEALGELMPLPVNLQAEAFDRGVYLTWEASVGANPPSGNLYYWVYRDGVQVLTSNNWSQEQYLDQPLEPETTYSYEVVAQDGAGTLSEPAVITVTTLDGGVTTERISVDLGGAQLTGNSQHAAVTPDGRYVAFVSNAAELLPPGATAFNHIFLLDRDDGSITLISRSVSGDPANSTSMWPSISDDGNVIAFASNASNLVEGDTNARRDIFVYNRQADTMTRANLTWNGGQANGASDQPAVSGDGFTVAFTSIATNLMPETVDNRPKVYVYDRFTGGLSRISGDEPVLPNSLFDPGQSWEPSLSANGRYVAYRVVFSEKNFGPRHLHYIYVHDRLGGDAGTGHTRRITPNGVGMEPSLSPDGRYVTFTWGQHYSYTSTYIIPGFGSTSRNVYLYDLQASENPAEVISLNTPPAPGNFIGDAHWPRLTPDLRFVTFASDSTVLVPGDTNSRRDIFVRDREAGVTRRVNLSSDSAQADNLSDRPLITADGSVVIYQSEATNLVPGDTNNRIDLFASIVEYADATPPDMEPPYWPDGDLSATSVGATVVSLAWSAAVDDSSGVAGYRLSRDGEQLVALDAGTRQHQVTGLSPDTWYAFKVEAGDFAGNWSEDGPSLAVQTQPLSDGSAALLATAAAGGVVELSWDPASGDVDAYLVQRRQAGDEIWAEVAEVGEAITTYTDTGLPAATSFEYQVRVRLQAGGESIHTVIATVTTTNLYITSVDWSVPGRTIFRFMAPVGGTFAMQVVGDPHRQVEALITYAVTADESGVPLPELGEGQATVALSEDPASAGTYAGEFTIADGIGEITAVLFTLSDGHGGEVSDVALGLPLPVAAGLEVYLELPDLEPELLQSMRINVWSDQLQSGASMPVTGSGSHRFNYLLPTADYHVRVLQSGHTVADEKNVSVTRGLYTELHLTPQLVGSLSFILENRNGEIPSDASVTVYDETGEEYLGHVSMSANGTANPLRERKLIAGNQLKVLVSTKDRYLQQESWHNVIIPVGTGKETLIIPWLPEWENLATVSGTVLGPDNEPVTGATITVQQPHPTSWRGFTFSVVTDSHGFYSMEVLPGEALISALKDVTPESRFRYSQNEVQFNENGQHIYDISLLELRQYTVTLAELELKFVDQPTQTLTNLNADQLWWGGVAMRVSGLNTGYNNSSTIHVERSLGGYPLQFWATATEAPTVSINATSLGFGPASKTLDLTEQAYHPVVFSLEQPSVTGVQATLLLPDGEFFVGAWKAWLYRVDEETGGERQVASISAPGHELKMYVPAAGLHRLEVEATTADGDILRLRREVDIPADVFVNAGNLYLQAPGIFALQPGNAVAAVPAQASPGGMVSIRATYNNSGADIVTDARLSFTLPVDVSIAQESVTLDGSPVASEINNGLLTVQLGDLAPQQRGAVRFTLIVLETTEQYFMSVAADIGYAGAGGQQQKELLGIARVNLVDITLAAPAGVQRRDFRVHGRAPAGSTVSVYDDGLPLATVLAAPNGYWQADIELPDRGTVRWHRLVAVADEGLEQRASAPALILYDASQPRLLQMGFRQALEDRPEFAAAADSFPSVGEWIHFSTTDGVARFPKTMLAGFPFEFELVFSNPDAVSDVEIWVTGPAGGQGTAVKREDGIWYAYVEPANRYDTSWELGPIYIRYTKSAEYSVYPYWIQQVVYGEPEAIEPKELEISTATADTDPPGPVFAAAVPFSMQGGAINGDFQIQINTGLPDGGTSGTNVSYPGDSFTMAPGESPWESVSVDWNRPAINRLNFSVTGNLPVSFFVDRDKEAPFWPEAAALAVAEMENDALTLAWNPAGDDTWVDSYRLLQDGSQVAEVFGDVTEYRVSGLTQGQTYHFQVVAVDSSGKATAGPSLEVEAGNQTATLSGLGLDAFQSVSLANAEPEMSGQLRIAAVGKGVKVAVDIGLHAATVNDILGVAGDTFNLSRDLDFLKDAEDWFDRCAAEGLPPELKDLFDKATMAIVADAALSLATTSVGVAASMTGVGTLGGLALLATGFAIGLVTGEIRDTALHNALRDYEYAVEDAEVKSEDCEDAPEDPRLKRKDAPDDDWKQKADPGWKIDPSGYVYEVVDENRIAGVQATLLYSEFEDGPWEVWDGEWWGEENPQLTTIDGRYAWDVPPGFWQVAYEKEGFELAFSDVLQVPPPHFDVNIPLRSFLPPSVTQVDGALDGEALSLSFNRHVRSITLSENTVELWTTADDPVRVTGTLVPQSPVVNPHDDSSQEATLTQTVRFQPDEPLIIGAEYDLVVSEMVESYAEVPMIEEYNRRITISARPAEHDGVTYTPNPNYPTVRVYGETRVQTAVAVSQLLYAEDGSAEAVVVARADEFPDALAGVSLAYYKNGPILLTNPDGLHPDTEAEIDRVLKPGGTVYVLGGTAALPAELEEVLELSYQVVRLGGINRYETAVKIAREISSNPTDVFLVTGENFADGLAISSAAARLGAPVLLTPSKQLNNYVRIFLADHAGSIENIYVIGGTDALSAEVYADAGGTKRIFGVDRWSTAVAIADEFFPAPQVITVATGMAFPDALSGGVLAAAANSPLLLTKSDSLPGEVKSAIERREVELQQILVLGGPGAISTNVYEALEELLP